MAESQEKKEDDKPEEYKESMKVSPVRQINFIINTLFSIDFQFKAAFVGGVMQDLFGGYEYPPYTVVNTFEVDGKKFEERKYEGGKKWVSHKKSFKKNEEKKASNELFMSLFNYIAGKNETCKWTASNLSFH